MRIHRMTLAAMLLAAGIAAASGPYSPVHQQPDRDEEYNAGKAIFNGEAISGHTSCASCHRDPVALKASKLRKRQDLPAQVQRCLTLPDRTNLPADSKTTSSLIHYLTRRFAL